MVDNTIKRRWQAVFSSNYQAIAIYRICLGIMLFIELTSRFQYLHAFYSDDGTLPLKLLLPKVDSLYKSICIHCYSGSMIYLQLLLSIQVILAFMLVIGYKTKFVSVISWILYLSLTLRNTWLNFILDRYFHHLLFYSMFLPLDAVWSIDNPSANNKKKQSNISNKSILSPATIAFKLLIIWLYWDAGYGKYSDPLKGWTISPLYNALPALDTYVRHTTIARYMYALLGPVGLRYMTPAVPYVEMFGTPTCLLGSYLGSKKLVYCAIGLMCGMHIGIAATMNNTVELSLVACVAWCLFLPESIGEDLGLSDTSSSSSGYEPTTTNNIKESIEVIARINQEGQDFSLLTVVQLKDKLRELNLKVGGRKQELIDRLDNHLYPDTVVELNGDDDPAAAASSGTASSDTTDNTKSSANEQPSKSLSWLQAHYKSAVLIGMFVCGSIWLEVFSDQCSQSMKHIWSTLLHNRWNVFVGAEEYVTWEIAPGRLLDGSIVDVWSKSDEVSWEMPGAGAPCTSTARAGRWRSFPYLAELDGDDGEALWSYLCRQWDDENGVNEEGNDGSRKLLRYNFFMLQADVLPNMGFSATRKRLMHSHDCLSNDNFAAKEDASGEEFDFTSSVGNEEEEEEVSNDEKNEGVESSDDEEEEEEVNVQEGEQERGDKEEL